MRDYNHDEEPSLVEKCIFQIERYYCDPKVKINA